MYNEKEYKNKFRFYIDIMNIYQQGKIYKISCKKTGKAYIGSTTKMTLSERLQGHVKDYALHSHGWQVAYLTSFQVLEKNEYEIELLENYPCHSREELHSREKFYIRSNECVNKVVPQRTRLEYRQDNKEKIKAYKKEYSSRKHFCQLCKIEVGIEKKARHEKTKRHLKEKENESLKECLNQSCNESLN